MNGAPVVVGTDGSEPAGAALALAAGEAAAHGRRLVIAHAVDRTPPPGPAAMLHESGQPALRERGESILREARTRAEDLAPGIAVETALSTDDARSLLAELGAEAFLTVVGSRGHGRVASGLLGSVTRHLTAVARTPVLVARSSRPPTGPVVLGVDGSPAAEAATAFAFQEAAVHETDLLALHAWTEWSVPTLPHTDPTRSIAEVVEELRDGEERLLAEALAGWAERCPEVSVERRSVNGRIRQTLLDAAAGAGLLVVGSRGRGGFPGLRLGSVSSAMLQHAPCPVAVVPGTDREP
ncbi:universal stress protein [Streptomyces sp. NPDC007083]|uniref:universal stress protein n=1 Tax=unclassified Streptomyces TaxID=2593676 RepID=UPI0034096352